MLEVINLEVTLGETRALDGASLRVGDGEIVAVLGPSGSGKSTLLRVIAGLVPADSGDVRWDGMSLHDVPTHKRSFGLMFQGYALFPHLSVGENVAFGMRMSNMSPAESGTRAHEALESVGLPGFAPRDVESLSGGERQRVALARTLAPEPRLVMLDEPLGALDRNLRDKLIGETRDILVSRGVTAIVVTHDRDEADQLSDRLAIMHAGMIVQTGTLAEILAAPTSEWVREFLG